MLKLIVFSFALLLATNKSFSDTCVVTPQQLEAYLKMDYQEFDQTPDKGFRELASKGCDYEAEQLIDIWHLHWKDRLLEWQDRVSYWHAGQVYAMVRCFNRTYKEVYSQAPACN